MPRVPLPGPTSLSMPALALGGGVLAATVAGSIPYSGDYSPAAPAGVDNAAPAIQALAHGQLGAAAHLQPVMGLPSLLVRVPATAAGDLLHVTPLVSYRLGALTCLLAIVLLASRGLRIAAGRGLICAALGLGVVLAGPQTHNALLLGHPEEVLAAALAAGAVLAGGRQRPVACGVLLGLAAATKPWGLLAALPALGALDARRRTAFGWAAAVGAAGALPLLLADPAAYLAAARELGRAHLVSPLSGWWALAHADPAVHGAAVRLLPLGLDRTTIGTVELAAVAAGLIALRRRVLSPAHAMLWLVLIGAVRCAADPLPVPYYYLAALVPLIVWETAIAERLPLISLAACLGAGAAFSAPAATAADLPYVEAAAVACLAAGLIIRRQSVRRVALVHL